ncbi:MAG: hypothetical protein F4W90_11150 [Gammaproteobacteria bacterium]|nr:hypothetical protein [Gammaproteobacteria bacterium]
MRDKALTSAQASIACLAKVAVSRFEGNDEEGLARFAKSFKFESWVELEEFIHNAANLRDARTAQYTRLLDADIETAWEFLADSAKLETWMFPAEFEAKPGANFNFYPEGWHGKIGVFERGREIRFDAVAGGWTWFSLKPIDDRQTEFMLRDYMAPDYVVADEIRRHPDDLERDQPGGIGTHWQGVLAGWHTGTDTLQDLFRETKRNWSYDALCNLYDILIHDYHRLA